MSIWSRGLHWVGAHTEFRPGLRPSREPPEPRSNPWDAEHRVLIQLMSELGAAMNGAGDATTFIRRALWRMGGAYGLRDLGIFVVPTLLLIRYGSGQATFVDLSSRIPTDLRLDQIAGVYHLVAQAEVAELRPIDGLRRLRTILYARHRFAFHWRILGLSLTACGISLMLRPAWEEVAVSSALALIVGLLREVGIRWPQLWPLVPPCAGGLVGAAAFAIIDLGVPARSLNVIIPAVATFLPGAALTVSMIELANGDVVAGGSRLAYGTIRLFLLVFGVLIAVQWAGMPEGAPEVMPETSPFLPLIGLMLFTAGVFVHFSGPRGSFPWLLLVVASAWVGQAVGSVLLGSYLGGFVGGAIMIVIARLVEGVPGAPPFLVSFTPAFWLLVPGALGFQVVAQLALQSPQSGATQLLSMFVAMVSIALGVLFGQILLGGSTAREPSLADAPSAFRRDD